MMEAVIFVLVGYLLGAISFSYIITKKIKKIDIRQHGSGNAGATNTLRVLGKGPAIFVLLLDVLKGVIPVVFQLLWVGPGLVPVLAGLGAIIGHNWPIYYGFKGGKGVATTIGVLFTLVSLPTLVAGVIAILAIVVTRFVSLGSLLFVFMTTIFTYFFLEAYPIDYLYLTIIVAILSFWRHRANIIRLIQGNESKIGQKKVT